MKVKPCKLLFGLEINCFVTLVPLPLRHTSYLQTLICEIIKWSADKLSVEPIIKNKNCIHLVFCTGNVENQRYNNIKWAPAKNEIADCLIKKVVD